MNIRRLDKMRGRAWRTLSRPQKGGRTPLKSRGDLARWLFGAPVSLLHLCNGKKEIGISGREIGKSLSEIPISFDDLGISGKEIGISSREIPIFLSPTTQPKWLLARQLGEME